MKNIKEITALAVNNMTELGISVKEVIALGEKGKQALAQYLWATSTVVEAEKDPSTLQSVLRVLYDNLNTAQSELWALVNRPLFKASKRAGWKNKDFQIIGRNKKR